MSITVTTEVFCDWCSNYHEHETKKVKVDIHLARREARRDGWRFRWSIARQVYEDLCPYCVKRIKEAQNA